jgi:hypothetical protein
VQQRLDFLHGRRAEQLDARQGRGFVLPGRPNDRLRLRFGIPECLIDQRMGWRRRRGQKRPAGVLHDLQPGRQRGRQRGIRLLESAERLRNILDEGSDFCLAEAVEKPGGEALRPDVVRCHRRSLLSIDWG